MLDKIKFLQILYSPYKPADCVHGKFNLKLSAI